jgi:hypothetical protein
MAELIGRALKIREPLTLLINEQLHRNSQIRLQDLKLSRSEWEFLSQLFPLLKLFLKSTKKISQSDVPLLHEVIPIFDIITRALDNFVNDSHKYLAVRAAAR